MGTPSVATVVKILARETRVEEIPMISGVVIRVNISHKTYPEMNPTIVSTKI
jgi:hypothetical protein